MTKPSKHKRSFSIFGIPVILALAAVLNMLFFQYKTSEWTKEWTYRVLDASAQEQTATLTEIFNGRFGILEIFASSLSAQRSWENDVHTYENITTRMSAIVEASSFEHLAVAGLDGIAHANDGQVGDFSNRYYMTQALAGHRAIQALTDSRLHEKDRLILSVPLCINDEVVGAVMGSLANMDIQQLLVSTAFSGNAYSYLCDSAGNIIVEAEAPTLLRGDNLLEAVATGELELSGGSTLKSVTEDLKGGRSGIAVISSKGESRYAVYQPVGINDWYIFNLVPSGVADQATIVQNRLGMMSIGVVTLCAVLLLFIMTLREKRRVRELKRLQEVQLTRYRTDPVTELLNASGFTHAVKETLDTLTEDHFCAMVDFEIINFNQYNVSFGGPAGDAVLRGAARTLLAHCRMEQPCARLSDDRFACFVTDCADEKELLERIVVLDKKLHEPAGTHQLAVSYGVYVVVDRTMPVEEMSTRAVAARLTADTGKHNINIYDYGIHQHQIEDAQLLEGMEEGLRLEQFIPYYQPKYDAKTECIVGAEALVRWIRPDGEVKPPNRFIQLFEQNGLITKLDLHMFERVCRKLSLMDEPVPISVNFSRAHLYDTDFPDKLLKTAKKHNVACSLLEIELTETAFFERRDALIQNINRLREMGFLVSVDDFGSGYSSLNLLKDVYFDIIKIDKEFLSNTTQTERDRIVIKSVLTLADSLKVHTVAEGVETREQLDFLRENGCDTIQGFYFSRPVPEAEFDTLLQARQVE